MRLVQGSVVSTRQRWEARPSGAVWELHDRESLAHAKCLVTVWSTWGKGFTPAWGQSEFSHLGGFFKGRPGYLSVSTNLELGVSF